MLGFGGGEKYAIMCALRGKSSLTSGMVQQIAALALKSSEVNYTTAKLQVTALIFFFLFTAWPS